MVGRRRVAGVERRARRHRRGQPRRGARIDDDHAAERHRRDAVLAGTVICDVAERSTARRAACRAGRAGRSASGPTASSFEIAVVQARDLRRRSALIWSTIAFAWRVDVGALRRERRRGRAGTTRRAPAPAAPAPVGRRSSRGWSRRSARRDQKLRHHRLQAVRRRAPGARTRCPAARLRARPPRPACEKAARSLLSLNRSRIRRYAATCHALAELARAVIMPHTESAPRAGFAARIRLLARVARRCWRSRCCGWSCRATPARPAGRAARC